MSQAIYMDTAYMGAPSTGVKDLLSLQDLSLEHRERLLAYKKYWDFFEGRHWENVDPDDDPVVTFNYCRKIVREHVNFLLKNGFDISAEDIPDGAGNQVDREFIKTILDATWAANIKPLWCYRAGIMGSVTGDVFIRPSWNENDPLEDPYVQFEVIPSHFCFPVFGSPTADDVSQLTEFHILIPRYVVADKRMFRSSRRTEVVRETWTKAVRQIFVDDKQVSSVPNPYGEIPIVHIQNSPSAKYFGISTLADIVELNRTLNEKATDVSDIVDYHGSPITVVSGARLGELERGTNRMWGLPTGAEAKNLEMSGDLPAAANFITTLKMGILELSDTVPQALGQENAPNVSGAALSMSYMPMLNARGSAMITYGEGIRQLNRWAIRILQMKDDAFSRAFSALPKNTRKVYQTTITFPPPFPRDEALEVSLSASRIAAALSTHKRELIRLGIEETEVNQLLEEIKEDQKEFVTIALSGGNQNPNRPNADVQGQKVSDKESVIGTGKQ